MALLKKQQHEITGEKKWYTGRDITTNYIIQRLVRKRLKKNEMSFWDLWDSVSHTNICVMGVPEEGGGEQVTEKNYLKE